MFSPLVDSHGVRKELELCSSRYRTRSLKLANLGRRTILEVLVTITVCGRRFLKANEFNTLRL